jgi:hypothetical protein
MNMRSFVTVSLCVILSIAVNLIFMWHRKDAENRPVVMGSAFHLVDAQGRVRAKLSLSGDRPSLTMFDEAGNNVIALGVERYGEGTMVFNSTKQGYEREGVVTLGYLTGSDTDSPEDPLGAWGVGIRLSPDKSTSMGLSKSGRSIGISAAVAH